ncbi:c-type cytochrome domain-containing protein [Rubritalea tangerina]|uniref:C-type cytochrome domain-containing protein n=1 Tax=Rubritalea tangerina TaxID=430798 RepID=A0ABW4Z9F0_9BACT
MLKNKWFWFSALSLTSILLLSLPVFFPEPATADSLLHQWCDFLGSFHPLILHLPIGFLTLIILLEAWQLISRQAQVPMTIPLQLNAVVAVIASLFGFLWFQTGQWSGESMRNHLWQGLIFSSCAIWLPWIYQTVRSPLPYRACLFGTLVIMTSAAHIGGESVHGDPLAKAPWLVNTPPHVSTPTLTTDPVVYTDIVVPILEQKCYKCHGADKQKGALRLDSIAFMIEGGESDTALIPGDASSSPLVTTIHLPLKDDYHMPPEGKPQVTSQELAVLEWWIDSGAKENTKLSQTQIPSKLESYFASFVTPKKTPNEATQETKQPTISPEVYNQFLTKYPHTLDWTQKGASTLRFSAASIRTNYHDKDLQALSPFSSQLVELDLNGTSISNTAATNILKFPNLEKLTVAATSISDDFIETLQQHKGITTLVLHSTEISDQSVDALASMQQLKKLFLWNTNLSNTSVKKLIKSLPNCHINTGENHTSHNDQLYLGHIDLSLSSRWHNIDRTIEEHFLNPNYQGPHTYTIHTNQELRPWVMLDLGANKKITRINLNNRTDLMERANQIKVSTSIDGTHWKSVYQSTNRITSDWKIKVQQYARYIKIELNKDTPEYLHLKNIQIYVTQENH